MGQKLWGFQDFSRSSCMLSATTNAAKFFQICPNLPKPPHRQLVQETLKFHQKLRFWSFWRKKKLPYVEGAPKHVYTVFDIQYKNFPYAFFNVQKLPLNVNFNIPLSTKWRFFQHSICLVDMGFCWHVPN
jgi:hypothetical protein